MTDKPVKKKAKTVPKSGKTAVIVFSKDQVEQIEKLAGMFLTREQIAAIMGISTASLYNVAKKQPEVLEALRKGPARTIASATATVVKNAQKGEQRAAEFILERKAGWKKDEEQKQGDITFVVEMNENGKFKQSRPKQIEEGAIEVDFEEIEQDD